MKKIIPQIIIAIGLLIACSCQKENVTRLNGTWKVKHRTDSFSSTVLGETASISYNYDLSNSDVYLTFELEDSDNAVLDEGTVTLSHGSETSSTGFIYSPTSKKLAFDRPLSVSSEVKDEDSNETIETTFNTSEEFDVQELTSNTMILFSSTQVSFGSDIQAKSENTISLSRVK